MEKTSRHQGTTGLSAALLQNLIASLNEIKSIDASRPVIGYLQVIHDLTMDDPSLYYKIEPVNDVLEGYGWKNGDFLYPPRLELLIEDLKAVLETGRVPPKRSKSMTDSQKLRMIRFDPLTLSMVRSLIEDILSPSVDLNKAVNDYFDLIDGLLIEKAEVAPVTKVLIDYGWTPKGFDQPVNRELLAKDLRVVAGGS